MNDYTSIANVINILRINKKLSQEQLANLINVSRTTITKIESGKRKPTAEQLILLSNKLDFDLISYVNTINKYKSYEHYLLAYELSKLVNASSVSEISKIIDSNPLFFELDYGEVKILRTYCETLVLIHIKDDIELAYDICIDFFNITNFIIKDFKPKINMPNEYYSMILNFGYCLSKKKDYSSLLTLQIITVGFLEDLYFSDELPYIDINNFYKKYYIVCLNNLADSYFTIGDFTNALDTCNKGINKSSQLNILSVLAMLIKLKIDILYNLDSLVEARETYSDFKSICKVTNNISYFNTSTKTLKIMYPKLFV